MKIHKISDSFKEWPQLVPKVNSKQARARSTFNNLLLAANKILHGDKFSKINARILSKVSGYGLATPYRYFNNIDHVFMSAVVAKRKKIYEDLVDLIEQHPVEKPIEALAKILIARVFEDFLTTNKKIHRLMVLIFIRRTKNPFALDNDLTTLVKPLIECAKRNQTNTFKVFSEDELLLRLKLVLAAIRRPIFESCPIAGSDIHIEIVEDVFNRLLSKI